MTFFWREILPNTPANMDYTITSYGSELETNKALLRDSFIYQNMKPNTGLFALMTSMAMVETTKMSVLDRDLSKDASTDGSANLSMFNLSSDLISFIGFTGHKEDLNKAENLPKVVELIRRGIDKLGIEHFLNFVRGGRKGFIDGVSFGASDYRSTIATILSLVDKHPSLLTDCNRVNIILPHV